MMIITAYALQKIKNYTIKCIKSRNENENRNRKRKSDRENARWGKGGKDCKRYTNCVKVLKGRHRRTRISDGISL